MSASQLTRDVASLYAQMGRIKNYIILFGEYWTSRSFSHVHPRCDIRRDSHLAYGAQILGNPSG